MDSARSLQEGGNRGIPWGIGMNDAFLKHFAESDNRDQKAVHGINYRKQWCNDIVW